MAKLTIEKSTTLDKVIRKVWVNMAVTAACSGFTLQDSREYIISTFQQWLPSTVTVGAGGSHIWISDSENNRIAIITF